jgi:regulatory protein
VKGRGTAPFGPPSLKARALAHLARREHSRAELARKLARHLDAEAPEPGDRLDPDDPRDPHDPHDRNDASDARAPHDPHDPPADRLGPLLDELAAAGWQSDERMAVTLAAGRGARGGVLRLRALMQRAGLAPALVAAAVAEAAPGELARASALLRRRFDGPPNSAAERARQARFLAARGFTGDTVAEALRWREHADDPAAAPPPVR